MRLPKWARDSLNDAVCYLCIGVFSLGAALALMFQLVVNEQAVGAGLIGVIMLPFVVYDITQGWKILTRVEELLEEESC